MVASLKSVLLVLLDMLNVMVQKLALCMQRVVITVFLCQLLYCFDNYGLKFSRTTKSGKDTVIYCTFFKINIHCPVKSNSENQMNE